MAESSGQPPELSLDSPVQQGGSSYSPLRASSNRIKLNVGGTMYVTTKNTLQRDPNSMLAAMFSGRYGVEEDGDGCCFIDRDGIVFRYVLNYLRDGAGAVLPSGEADLRMILKEAQYFNLQELCELAIEELSMVTADTTKSDVYPVPELSRRDVVMLIAQRGSGIILDGLNLSKIDLSGMNLAGTSFQRCDLTAANFSKCDLSQCTLNDAICEGANFSNAILSASSLVNTNICGADFTATSLDSAELHGAQHDEKTVFRNAELQFAQLDPELRRFARSHGAVEM